MKFRLLLLVLLAYSFVYAQDEELNASKKANVNNIISLFKRNNVNDISNMINYPLRREYPIPDIKNKKEFKQRFSEVFDKVLIRQIAHSKTSQWSEVGWRGIMLDNGLVWIDSYVGKIVAVNYESPFEKNLREKLIQKEKESVHISLKKFEIPVYKIKTKQYLIRIDKISDDKYRYASWKAGSKENTRPDLILNNGELDFLGSGGNHVITFTSGNYTYKVYRNIITEENGSDANLEVEKDGQIILNQNGTLTTN